MTEIEFYCACGDALIEPLIALENENIVEALKEKDSEKVRVILREEF